MRSAKDLFRPLAVGAPEPLREIPFPPSRMIHFFDPSNEKMAAKVPDLAKKVDILLGNLEDAIKADNKEAAREGLVRIASETDFGDTQIGRAPCRERVCQYVSISAGAVSYKNKQQKTAYKLLITKTNKKEYQNI